MGSDASGGPGGGMTRRSLVAGGALAGGAALLGPLVSTPLARGGGGGGGERGQPGAAPLMTQPFSDPNSALQAQFVLGAAGYGAAEYGEVATAIDRTRARGSGYDALYDEFRAMGLRVGRMASASLRGGHPVSARAAYLRSAGYLTLPLFFVLGTARPGREPGDYRAMQRRWAAAARLFDPPLERVRIPYPGRGGPLPGYLMRPPGPVRRRPTVILNNGNDAQNVDVLVYGGAAAVARGWNALMFEGPGQGAMWFLRRVPFRPDWERVVTPVVTWLMRRPEVDRRRVAIIGWSQGGGLVARAAAFERRLAAVVLDPGFVDFMQAFRAIPREFIELVDEGRRAEADRIWAETLPGLPPATRLSWTKTTAPFGQRGFYDAIRTMQRFSVGRFLPRIRTPTLVTQYELDDAFPGAGRQAYGRLRTRRDFVEFTVADGAQYHCGPMAPQRRNQVIFDWLEDIFARAADRPGLTG